jgi:hypothetical protein
MDSLNKRVSARLKEEKDRHDYSDADVGGMIRWTASKVSQKMNARSPITVDELEALCSVLRITPAECLRDRELEFWSEMTPQEVRFLQQFRRLPKEVRDGLAWLITHVDRRGATKTS